MNAHPWVQPMLEAVASLRTAQMPVDYANGGNGVLAAVRAITDTAAWLNAVRNDAQVVVGWAELLTYTPDDANARESLVEGLDQLVRRLAWLEREHPPSPSA